MVITFSRTQSTFSGAVKFATFELSKVFVEARIPLKFHPVAQFACAAGAMLACSVFLVPGEVLKTRLQAGVVGGMTPQMLLDHLFISGFSFGVLIHRSKTWAKASSKQ